MTRVKELRDFRGMTQDQFAEFCDVSRMTISRAELSGKISRSSAVKIAEACGVTVGYVLGTEDRDVFVSPGKPFTFHIPDGAGNVTVIEHSTDAPKTPQARILAAGIDKMPERDREKALKFVMMMFEQYADFFEQEDKTDGN